MSDQMNFQVHTGTYTQTQPSSSQTQIEAQIGVEAEFVAETHTQSQDRAHDQAQAQSDVMTIYNDKLINQYKKLKSAASAPLPQDRIDLGSMCRLYGGLYIAYDQLNTKLQRETDTRFRVQENNLQLVQEIQASRAREEALQISYQGVMNTNLALHTSNQVLLAELDALKKQHGSMHNPPSFLSLSPITPDSTLVSPSSVKCLAAEIPPIGDVRE
ncbi:hypothetical protein Dda_7415 [Drechslerella dactyloides]|uniref:Uncharacterized protein n=1 Tax=Drechslerella dactyloides TaxID=74499 RepID=A0AAD6IS42_DREDA|nr:hypothetical protein Dda_7415 [Drechslerella dactyloides]